MQAQMTQAEKAGPKAAGNVQVHEAAGMFSFSSNLLRPADRRKRRIYFGNWPASVSG
jgi:hypothetical protein